MCRASHAFLADTGLQGKARRAGQSKSEQVKAALVAGHAAISGRVAGAIALARAKAGRKSKAPVVAEVNEIYEEYVPPTRRGIQYPQSSMQFLTPYPSLRSWLGGLLYSCVVLARSGNGDVAS